MIETIVVAVDESEASRRALERTAALAKAFASQVVVTSVAPVTTTATARSIGADPVETAADHVAELSSARKYLQAAGLTAVYVEALGHERESILAVARERSADLIVIGAGEPSLVARLLGHDLAGNVAHGAHCDVLIVH